MALLGGSPLGLINVRSLPTSDGMSTFNGGTSRKISVNSYNNATGGQMNQTNGNFSGSVGTRSLFSGSPSASVAPYGNVGKLGTTTGGGMDMSGPYKGIKRSSLHNNTVYDMSLLNIIEQLSGTQAELRPSDFAYLKDVGVFPNNRLMIARRFASPHHDNIFLKGLATGQPLAIMISWKPQGDDFLKITFGEKWEDADADFKNVLDSLGEDFLGKELGKRIGGGIAVVPLPGFTETIQRTVLAKLGVIEDDIKTPLPSGNPNLIKMAKRRQTIKSEVAGSGLNCTVSIQMVCEWEQKFLSGIDPTIAWQDILGKILTFSTSRSNNYGLKGAFEKTMTRWMDYPNTIVEDMVKYIKEGLTAAKDSIREMIQGVKSTLLPQDEASVKKKDAEAAADKAKKLKDINNQGTTEQYADKLIKDLQEGLSRQLNKYRIALEGIARSLSGAPSTPWHITVGNPLRPIFCSGDMYMADDLTLDLGATLAFNDLPSSIKATFTLTNARPWGLQEIAAKFNAGSIRVVTSIKDANDLNHGERLQDQIYVAPQAESTKNPTNTTAATNTVAGAAATGAVAGVAGATVPTTTAQVTPAIATVAAGPQVTPIPTFANNFNADISTAVPNLTAGAATNLASAQGTLDGVTAAVNSGQAQAEALAAKATAAATAAAAAAGSVTGGVFNGAIAGAVAAAQNAVTNTQNTVATVGANVSSTAASAVGTVKESVNSQSVVPDPNSSVGTTLQNIDWSAFAGI